MKVALRLGVIVFFLAATAFAGSPEKKGTALSDKQLDAITAGVDSAKNGSTLTLNRKGTVTLKEKAQEKAKGLNLVNSAESTVGNGVNVLDTKSSTTGHVISASQTNSISQSGGVTENFPFNPLANAPSTVTTNPTSRVTLNNDAQGEAKGGNLVNAAGSLVANGVNVTRTSKASSIGVFQFNSIGQGGGVIAINSHFLSAPISTVTLNNNAQQKAMGLNLVNSSGSSVANGVNIVASDPGSPTTDIFLSHFNSIGQGGGFLVFGSPTFAGRVFTSNPTSSVTLNANAQQSAQGLNLVNAAGSQVANGVDIVSTRESRFLFATQRNFIGQGGGGFASGANFTSNPTSTVTLDANAQQKAQGLNLVNAAGSQVANGVNVLSTRKSSFVGASQFNSIGQGDGAATAFFSFYTSNPKSTLTLDENAQENARGLNLVNASGSSVANGVNVFSSAELDTLNLFQGNSIFQGGGLFVFGSGATSNPTSTLTLNNDAQRGGKKTGGVNLVNAAGSNVANGVNVAQTSKARAIGLVGQSNFIFQGGGVGASFSTFRSAAMSTVTLNNNAQREAMGVNLVNAAGSQVANGVDVLSSGESEFVQGFQSNFIGQGGGTFAFNSQVTSNPTSTVTLNTNAQQEAQGLNLVNAAGSQVANGVNVQSTRKSKHVFVSQFNSIGQGDGFASAVLSGYTSNPKSTLTLNNHAQENAQGLNLVNASGSSVANGVNVFSSQDKKPKVAELDILTLFQANFIGQGGSLFVFGSLATANPNSTVTLNNDAQAAAQGLNLVNAAGSNVANAVNVASTQKANTSIAPFTFLPSSFVFPTQTNFISQGGGLLTGIAAQGGFTFGVIASASATSSVTLSNNAQQKARGLNLVNAAGSTVANAVNVLASNPGGSKLNINLKTPPAFLGNAAQSNTILQNAPSDPKFPVGRGLSVLLGTVTSNPNNTVTLNSHAQENAAGLNLVNAAGSQVANAVNILSSREPDPEEPNNAQFDTLTLDQKNTIRQGGGVSVAGSPFGPTTVSPSSTVTLTGDAQGSATGLNLVNAAGGSVANAVNVATTSKSNQLGSISPFAPMKQSNTIDQGGGISVDSARCCPLGSGFVFNGAVISAPTSTVTLSLGAQQNARAMNLVNAANSLVANAVNVTSVLRSTGSIALTQSNTISQGF